MALARLRSSSVVRVFAAFTLSAALLSIELRGPIVSKIVFVGLPALLAVISTSELMPRVIHFIVLAELMTMSIFWPVSLLSKALLFTAFTWYLAEFPERALANLMIAAVVLIVAIVSAPVTQQF